MNFAKGSFSNIFIFAFIRSAFPYSQRAESLLHSTRSKLADSQCLYDYLLIKNKYFANLQVKCGSKEGRSMQKHPGKLQKKAKVEHYLHTQICRYAN